MGVIYYLLIILASGFKEVRQFYTPCLIVFFIVATLGIITTWLGIKLTFKWWENLTPKVRVGLYYGFWAVFWGSCCVNFLIHAGY